MNLDRIYNIVSVVTAVLIVLPFLLEGIGMPHWCWTVLTVLIFVSMAVWVCLFAVRKSRERREKKEWEQRRKR